MTNSLTRSAISPPHVGTSAGFAKRWGGLRRCSADDKTKDIIDEATEGTVPFSLNKEPTRVGR